MELNEDYKNALAKLAILEKRANASKASKGKPEEILIREIEAHFKKSIQALEARKAALISEVHQKLDQQQMAEARHRDDSEKAVIGCRDGLKTGSLIYEFDKIAASAMWKAVGMIQCPASSAMQLHIDLPWEFVEAIPSHGSVSCLSLLKPGVVTTFVGSSYGNTNGCGTNAKFDSPRGICMNRAGDCLFVCDRNNGSIKKVMTTGEVQVLTTEVKFPLAIAVHSDNTIFVCEHNTGAILKIINGVVSKFATISAQGIAVDQRTGDVFVSGSYTNAIHKITPQGNISILAGKNKGFINSSGSHAMFNRPVGLTFCEKTQSLIVCDFHNDRLRRVLLTGEVTTICKISGPLHIAITKIGSLLVTTKSRKVFVASKKRNRDRYTVEPFAGSGSRGYKDGTHNESCFRDLCGIAINENSNECYVVDHDRIRKITQV